MELGKVAISYQENGDVEKVLFTPAIKSDFTKLRSQLKKIGCSNESSAIMHNAEMVLADWIGGISAVEEEDIMFGRQIKSEITACEKHSNGLVKFCEINFKLN